MLRTDTPEKIIYFDKGRAILPNEKFLVCKRYGSREIVVQSERSDSRAEYSVNVMNEHEMNNARSPVFYWRVRKEGE